MFAALWGVSIYGDIFFLAFKIPNLLRRFFAEGAMSSAFIPIFSKLESNTENSVDVNSSSALSKKEFYFLIFWLLSLTMIGIVLIGIWLAPAIAHLLFVFQENKEVTKLAETTLLIRILFPYIGFISLCALQQGVLENHGKFSFSASVPVLFNLIMIFITTTTILLDSVRFQYEDWFIATNFFEFWGYQVLDISHDKLKLREFSQTLLIASGILVGGIVQLVYAGMGVRSLKYSIFKVWDKRKKNKFKQRNMSFYFQHATTKKFVFLLIPVFLASGSYQLQALLLDPITFSLGEGAVSLLYFANRLLEFPLGIVGVAITTASLPLLSREAKSSLKNSSNHKYFIDHNFKQLIESSLNMVLLLFIPLMIVSGFYPNTIVSLVFKFQAFSDENVYATARCFLFLLPSLLVLAGYRILFNGFYATENTKVPLKVSMINLFVGLPFAYILIQFYPYPEMIALSGTVCSYLIFLVTVYFFKIKLSISLFPFFIQKLRLVTKLLFMLLPIIYITYRLIDPFFMVLYETTTSLWLTKLWQFLELSLFSGWVFLLYGLFLIILKEPQALKAIERIKKSS